MTLISSSKHSRVQISGHQRDWVRKCTYLCQSTWHSLDCDSELASSYAKGVHFNFLFKALLMQHIQILSLILQYSDLSYCTAAYCLYPNLQNVWLNGLLTYGHERIQVYAANSLPTQCVYYCSHHLKWPPSPSCVNYACGPVNISLINCHL